MNRIVGLDRCLGRPLILELALLLPQQAEMSYLEVAPIFVGCTRSASGPACGDLSVGQRSPVMLFVDRRVPLVFGHVVRLDPESFGSLDSRLGRRLVAV